MKWTYSLLLILALLCMLASGCYTKKQAVRKFCTPSKEISRDSSWSEKNTSSSSNTLKWDSSIVYPETMLETTFQPCDSLGKIIENLNLQLQSGHGKLTIKSDANGMLRAKCSCDSVVNRFQKELQSKDSAIEVLEGSAHFEEKIPPAEIREVLYWWVKPSFIALGILSIPGILKLIRYILPWFK